MKKFIFSAIAMVAFMGSSMANTIEIDSKKEKESIEVNNTIINISTDNPDVILKTTPSDCLKIKKFVASVLLNSGESGQTASYFANFVYDACMDVLVN